MKTLTHWAQALLLLALSAVAPLALAENAEAFADRTSAELLSIIQAGEASYATDPAPVQAEMGEFLDQVVDFDRIVIGVMGKHGESATPEQVQRFRQVFRDGLVRAYSDALVGFGATRVDVVGIKGKKPDRKSVDLQARGAEGAKVAVRYSVAEHDDVWKVQNLTIEGINLGLTFRNQFDSAMGQHGQDIDKVIDNWSTN